jgi:hypothetical protein
MPVRVLPTLTGMAALGTAVAAVSALMVGASSIASAQSAAPKAYIGLFGDNAIAVLDTANKVPRLFPFQPVRTDWSSPRQQMGLREQ